MCEFTIFNCETEIFAIPEWNISLSVRCIVEICYKHVGSRMIALA
jgi:hypothetical protein